MALLLLPLICLDCGYTAIPYFYSLGSALFHNSELPMKYPVSTVLPFCFQCKFCYVIKSWKI